MTHIAFVKPFIGSVEEFFKAMLGGSVSRGRIRLRDTFDIRYEFTAMIELFGGTCCFLALSFPPQTAHNIVGRMLGAESGIADGTIVDGVGEIVNIVAGAAKNKMLDDERGKPIDLGLPNVIRGEEYSIEHSSDVSWVEVPFTSDFGPFNLRVTCEQD